MQSWMLTPFQNCQRVKDFEHLLWGTFRATLTILFGSTFLSNFWSNLGATCGATFEATIWVGWCLLFYKVAIGRTGYTEGINELIKWKMKRFEEKLRFQIDHRRVRVSHQRLGSDSPC